MALQYFLYDTDFGNTIIDRSETSFSPALPYEEIYIDFFIPETQPLYLYANSGGTGGTIIVNTQENIDNYLDSIAPAPTADDNVTYGEFSGATTMLENYTGNGIVSGLTLSVNTLDTGRTTINISAGIGYIVDNHTNPEIPVVTKIEYSGQTGITIQNIGISIVTYIGLDSSGNTVQQITEFTPSQRRDYIILGLVIHSDLVKINVVNNLPDVVLDSHSQLNDFFDAFKTFNINGNVFSANGANLFLDKSQGNIFKRGVNFETDNKNPNIKTTQSLNTITDLRYRLSDGTEYLNTGNTVSLYQENPLGTRVPMSSTGYSVQHIVLFPSNLVRIQYGQSEHPSMANAINAIYSNPYVVESNIQENGLLRGYLIIKGSVTDLTNTDDAKFIEADRFGVIPKGGETIAYGLQEVTETDASTNIETTFESGLVLDKLRPTTDSVSAITINKTDGITPVITIDTVSGLTGFGTIPTNMIHTYGIDDSEDDINSTHKNGIRIDGVTGGDKDLVWADNGVDKWFAEIYRNEEGRFWYLYNEEGDLSPITVSESGRIGLNSTTNIIDYQPIKIKGLYAGLSTNNVFFSGLFDKNYISIYQLEIDDSITIPNTFRWRKSTDDGLTYDTWSNSTGCTTGTTLINSGVEVSFIDISGFTSGDTWQITAFPQLSPATLSLVANRLNRLYITYDYTAPTPTYYDLSTSVNTTSVEAGFAFQTGTTNNAVYIGGNTKINSVFVNVLSAGVGMTSVAEYWNGVGWTDITVGSDYFVDGTNNLTQIGTLSWNITTMTDWTLYDLNGSGDEFYWMRLRTSSAPTVSPFVGGIARGGNNRFAVYSSAFDLKPSFNIDALGRTNIGGGNMTGCNLLQINNGCNVKTIECGRNNLVEIDSNDADAVDLKIKLSSENTLSGGLTIVKTRGTLSSAKNLLCNDSIGHVDFRAQVNDAGGSFACIHSQYKGNCTTKYADLIFSTASGDFSTEKVRITNSGTTGFGVQVPIARIHIQSGSTSIAPLKFISGNLLSTPQEGAVEFNGSAWYGTITGDTRKEFAFTDYTDNIGLQEITDIGATTTNETTFYDGIVLTKARPTGDTRTSFQFNKTDGVTPVLNIDTLSGLTGINTIESKGLVHAYGVNSGGGIDSSFTQTNAFIIDGPVNVDKDINWSENGEAKWLADTYRNEESKFWYLYNVSADNVNLAIHETGRVGINKQPNTLNSHAILISGNSLNDLYVTGVYTQNYNSVFEIRIASTGATDTFDWRVSIDTGVNYSSWSTPSGVTTTPIPLENGVEIYFDNLTGHTIGTTWSFGAYTQIPEATFTVAPMGFKEVLKTLDYTAPTIIYQDITAWVNGGSSENTFILFETGITTQSLYIGNYIKLNSIYINLDVVGTGIILITEYWNGTNWIQITSGDNYLDETNNFTKSGRISWSPNSLTGWILSAIPDEEHQTEEYWIRIRTSTSPTTSPTVKNVGIGNDKRFGVYASYNDYNLSFFVDSIGRTSIGGGNLTSCNLLQVGTIPDSCHKSQFESMVQFETEKTCIAGFRLRLSSEDDKGFCLGFAKNRGKANNPLPVQEGDEIGHILWGAGVGTIETGVLLADIYAKYTGDGTSKYGDLIFQTHSNISSPLPTEIVRMTGSGNTGFGITIPTAKIHITSGSTTVAPLKFNTGDLLTTPQIGAMEFQGNSWYGTPTGGTRKTFAFLESPVFTGTPYLPTGTTFDGVNLIEYIIYSGGSNNDLLVKTSDYDTYTGATDTRLQGIEGDIIYISGVTDTKLLTATFNAYTGGTIAWDKVNKTGSDLADLETRNASDVNISLPHWVGVNNVDDYVQKSAQYTEDTQGSGRLSPETVLTGRLTQTLIVSGGTGYISYTDFHSEISWSAQTFNVSGYTEGTYYVYVDTNGDIQVDTSNPDGIHNIRLGFFYWGGSVIGVIQQCGCIVLNSLARSINFMLRQGYFIYDNGGKVQVSTGNTLHITSPPCKVQFGLLDQQLSEISSADASTFKFLNFYNSSDLAWETNYYFSLVDGGQIPTNRWNDITKPSHSAITASVTFTQGSNVVTGTTDLTSLISDDNFIYLSGDTNLYMTPVTGVTWTGSQTNIYLKTPYFGAGGTGTMVANYTIPKLPAGKYARNLVIRSSDDNMYLIFAQTYYDNEALAVDGALPALPPSLNEAAIKMAAIITTSGVTDLTGKIYDIRPLPFQDREGGQAGGGTTITIHGELAGLGADDHLQYLRTDGSRNLTGIQRYQSQPTFTTDLDVITRKYVNDADNLKLNITNFNTYSGTTVPNTYYNKTEINTYTGNTQTMYDDTKEPTGFINNENIDVSYNSTNRTITLSAVTGNVEYYWKGVKYSLGTSWTSSAHANSVSAWFLYSTDGQNFVWYSIPWEFDDLQVAYRPANTSWALREVHGTMPYTVHREFHRVIGTYRVSGFGLTTATYAIQPANPTDADNTPGFDAGIIADEDIQSTLPAWTEGSYTQIYFVGTGTPTFLTTQSNLFRMGGVYPLYNRWNGSSFSDVEMANDNYANWYLIRIPVASDSGSQLYRAVVLQPQYTYISLAAAQSENPHILNLDAVVGLSTEFVLAERITLRTNSDYSGATGNVRIEAYGMLTTSRIGQVGSSAGIISVSSENVSVSPTSPFISTNLQTQSIEYANAITARLTISNFNTYSGTTVPNTYYNKTQINSYTGATNTKINTKASLSGATFTGEVRVPKPVQNDNSTCAATTSWYISQGAAANPLMDGSVAIGTSNLFARQDHIHPTNTSRLAVSIFSTYTGTTAPATFASKSFLSTYTGTTAPNTYLSKTSFNTYSGTTIPNTYYNKTEINSYSGATATAIGLKANIASPAFTGIPTAPTAAANTSTTQIATTAYVVGQAANVNPLMDGTVAIGTSLRYARQDHVHASDTTKQNTITGGATTITTNDLTTGRTLISNATGKVVVSTVTSARLVEVGAKVYGENFQYVQDLTTTTTTNVTPTFATKITVNTASLPIGTYKVTASYGMTTTVTNSDMLSRIQVDAVNLGSVHNFELGDNTTWVYTTRETYITFATATTHTITLQFATEGAGTLSMRDANVSIIRVS